MSYDVIIIGGGAAGLSAACTLMNNAKNRLRILVLEKESVCGRKLSASGNGRCNLANADFSARYYFSDDRQSCEDWVFDHSQSEVLDFFREMGIPTYEKNGYYYPLSNQAKQVTSLLWERCAHAGVEFALGETVLRIAPKRPYRVTTDQGRTVCAYYVLLCTGGLSAPQLGGTDIGYRIATGLRLAMVPTHPVLSPIYIDDAMLQYAKGVRLDATVTLQAANGDSTTETGQVQFNADCLSGIVIMNLTCRLPALMKEQIGYTICMDCLPDWHAADWHTYLIQQCETYGNETISNILNGIFPHGFVMYLLRRLQIPTDTTVSSMNSGQLHRIASACKKLVFSPVFQESAAKSQVTAGGVALREVSVDTFAATRYDGLYIAGELLDINGCCGGYNIMFAVLSGIRAAQDIERRVSLDTDFGNSHTGTGK